MITIGIDPGIEKTGIGIVELDKQKLSLIYHELIRTSSKDSHGLRLKKIYDKIDQILTKYSIDFGSVEKLFFAKNVKTAMMVSEARGVVILALQQHNISIHEYTPLQVKQGLVGYGRAEKRQVRELVKIILDVKEIPAQDDVVDGIALAIIHINTYKTMSRIQES